MASQNILQQLLGLADNVDRQVVAPAINNIDSFFTKTLPKSALKTVNQVGKAVGQESLIPGILPSNSQLVDKYNQGNADANSPLPEIPGGGLLHGNSTPASLLSGALGLGMIAEGGVENPEDEIKDMPQSELDKFNLPAAQLDMYTPAKVSEIKDTLLNDVPGSTWSEKNVNMKGAMKDLTKQINNAPNVQVPMTDYQEAGANRLKPLVTAGKLSDQQANSAVTSWLGRIYNAAKPSTPPVENTLDENGNLVAPKTNEFPTTIDKDTAVAMHKANNDAVGTFYKSDGTLKDNLSPEDEAKVALRNASSDVLKNNLPDVNDLIQKQSHLFKADNVVGRLASDEQSANLKAQNASSATPSQNPLVGLLKGSVSSPSHVLATGGVLASLGMGAYGANIALSQPKNYKFSSGAVNLPGLNEIKDSTGNSMIVNPADFQNQLTAINNQEKQYQFQASLGIPSATSALANLELQKQSLTNKFNTVKPVYDQYVETSNQMQGLNQAQQLIKSANPQWFQAFGPVGGQLTSLRAALVPGYAKFEQQLNNLHQQFGIDVSAIKTASSPEAADAAINQTVKAYESKLQNTVKNSGGVWPGEAPPIKTGGDVLKNLLQQTNQDSTSTPSPSPTTTVAPTPDAFQKLLIAPFRAGTP